MSAQEKSLKNLELRLISELLKGSRRSDRELAKALGVSQPTVSRAIGKLEKQGFIRNYTILPVFGKLGYTLLAITYVKLRVSYTEEEIDKVRRAVRDAIEQSQFGIIMLERGIGLGYDACIMAIYKDYSEYSSHKNVIKNFPFIDNSKIETFIINLEDPVRYRPLNFDIIAKQLETKAKKETEKKSANPKA